MIKTEKFSKHCFSIKQSGEKILTLFLSADYMPLKQQLINVAETKLQLAQKKGIDTSEIIWSFLGEF